ncbi:hypothetical protein B9Z55_028907 [Caenorhabditis nigoni]|uniref:Uncharacterized protein n=1 Tax=Caenorhabditis nigoni TaxID=1611254 RepID=A0A2G5S9M9_9PELO|nr:hypothetical protein B9Z55_028907 [Caenorhabditis nigoni]
MKSEVSDALKATSTLRKILDDEDDHTTMNTMSLEEVLKNFDTKNVEFIRYPFFVQNTELLRFQYQLLINLMELAFSQLTPSSNSSKSSPWG